MANSYPKQFNVSTAVSSRNSFNNSFQVVTTANFGVLKPLLCKYVVPTDKITKCQINEFQRLMPMPCPTFGKIDSITRCFFVPMRAILHSFNEFVSFNPYYSSQFNSGNVSPSVTTPVVPYTNVGFLNVLFCGSTFSTSGSATDYDFAVFASSTATTLSFRKFTLLGKRIYDMLISIGCNFPWLTAPWGTSASSNMRSQASQRVSLLPIFAIYKAYIDWIVPSRYYHNYSALQSMFRMNNPANAPMGHGALISLFVELRSFLESDFFTSAFASPLSESAGQITTTLVVPNPGDYSSDGNSYSPVVAPIGRSNFNSSTNNLSPHDGAKVSTSSPDEDLYINTFTIQSLGALQSMLNRGLIAGTKIQTWLETEFGIKPDNAYLDLSSYLGRFENTISIGDVTSYADTVDGSNGSYLGQYAGKGVGSGQAHFEFDVKEHGFFIVFNEVLPRTSYYQGLHPEFQMLDRFDFFSPAFDNLGMEAIPLRTLVNSQKTQLFTPGETPVASELSDPDSIFGFCPRYAPLKSQFDIISGDFRVNSLNTGLDSWYLSRDFDLRVGVDEDYKYISPAFCDGSDGSSTNSYDRIFQFTDGFADHFYQIFVFDFVLSRPMKSVQDYMIDNQEDLEKGSKVIGVNVHGNDNV